MKIDEKSGYITDDSLEPTEQIILDDEYQPLCLPVKQYVFFMANGSVGIEAMTLLLHLLYTSRRQHTNQVWAKNTYIRKGLTMGERTVIRAKKFLSDHGFISYVRPKDNDTGKFNGDVYIRINYMRNPGKREDVSTMEQTPSMALTTIVDNRTSGSDIQMLEETNKCLKKQVSTEPTSEVLHCNDELLTMLNHKTGLDIGKEGFAKAIEKVLPAFRHLDFILYAFFEKPNCNAGTLLTIITKEDVQKRYTASLVKPVQSSFKESPSKICKVCGLSYVEYVKDMGCTHCSALPEEQEQQAFIAIGNEASGGYLFPDDADAIASVRSAIFNYRMSLWEVEKANHNPAIFNQAIA